MTPEQKARQIIDKKLEQSGWIIQDMKQLNLIVGLGVAVREFPTSTGPVDYALFVDGTPVGIIEAKKDDAGENITAVEGQSNRYVNSTFKVEMIKSFSPISDFYKVVTASAQAMGSIVFYTKGRKCRKHGIPCFRLNNKVFPSAVINCYFNIFIFCIRNKFFKIFNCNFEVFVKAITFSIVNTAVKNGATNY